MGGSAFQKRAPSLFNFMKTIIFDIDGTITNMWPVEKSVLLRMTGNKFEKKIESMKSSGVSDTYKIFRKLSGRKIKKEQYADLYNQTFSALVKSSALPALEKYPLADWILVNRSKYHFVYLTSGQRLETRYVLKNLGIAECFDLENSIDKTRCRFSKRTGIPFKKIKSKFRDCVFVSDSKADRRGATLAKIPTVLVRPKQQYFDLNV